jgi:PKD domain-containing protein
LRLIAPTSVFLLGAVLAVAATPSKTPSVKLRASVRVAAAPATVIFNAELAGGEDGEGLYCPTFQWDWGDGTKSETGGSCEPFQAGVTKIERRFTATHEYRSEGRPSVRVRVHKGERELGQASISLVIGPPKKPLSGTFRGR